MKQASIDAVFEAARTFFALPAERKDDPRIQITPQRTRGYQALFARHYANTDAPDVNEAFKYQHDYPATDPDIVAGNRFHQPQPLAGGPAGLARDAARLFRRHGEAVGSAAARLRAGA